MGKRSAKNIIDPAIIKRLSIYNILLKVLPEKKRSLQMMEIITVGRLMGKQSGKSVINPGTLC